MKRHPTRALIFGAVLPSVGVCVAHAGEEATAPDAASIGAPRVALSLFEPPPDPAPQPAAQPLRPGSDEWWTELNLTIWLPGIDGTIGVRDASIDVSASFTDVLSESDSLVGVAGGLQVGKGRLGGYVDGFWTEIKLEQSAPLGTADVTNEIGIFDFGLSYEIGRWPMECSGTAQSPPRDLVLVAYAGGRYTSVDIDVDFPVAATRSGDEGWVDPMIGARLSVPFAPHWSLAFRGDVGGFGAASDFAWTAAGAVSWDFHLGDLPSSLQFGYIAIGDDYTTGSGADRFEWDTILHGLTLNLAIRF